MKVWDASSLVRLVGDAPLTVESSDGCSFTLQTIWLLADESLRTPLQVLPKVWVKVAISRTARRLAEWTVRINCTHLLSQKSSGWGRGNKKWLSNFPSPQELVEFTPLPLRLVGH